MKKILVTGGSGLLGINYLQKLKEGNKVLGTYNRHQVSLSGVDWVNIDLLNEKATSIMIATERPDIIIHCAALTDVDFCERYPGKATQLNVEVSSLLSRLARKYDCRFLHISTDAVYGTGPGNFAEEDELFAVNKYGHTKILAEKAVTKINSDALIIRTAIYGWNIQNKYSFAEAIVEMLLHNKQATLFRDVFFSPILTNHLVEITMELLAKGGRGVYNVGSFDGISKFDFGNVLAEMCGLQKDNILPINLHEKKLVADRPMNTTMNVQKASAFLGQNMPTVRHGLECFWGLLVNGYLKQFKPGVQTLQQLKKVWQ